jgi:uncharacterized membrane protein
MTGSAVGMIITTIVTVIVLAAWIVLVFYADAHPAWRRKASSDHSTADLAPPVEAGRPEEIQHPPRQEEPAPATSRS